MSSAKPGSRGNFDTSSEQGASQHSVADSSREPLLGFVVVWSGVDTGHLGAWLPVSDGSSSGVRIFGRGLPGPGDDRVGLAAVQQRPDGDRLLPPFQSTSLSRIQLELSSQGLGPLRVKNVGRPALRKNGEPCQETSVEPGDVLEIGTQLALLCSIRSRRMEGPAPAPDHVFGEPDAHGFVGEAPAAWSLRARVAFAAPRSGHVLVLGPTGVGKELITHSLHALSGREGGLVSRNAATLPRDLVDAELFGNRTGYPHPATTERPGLVGEADRGTLFLDGFAELAGDAQAHLLRILDSGEYHRLGESSARRSSLRLIAAVNRPESELRQDLLARFDFRIDVPDLKARLEDIPLLARYLLRRIAAEQPELAKQCFWPNGTPRFDSGFARELLKAPLPGNVRELRQILWAALSERRGELLQWPRAGQLMQPEPPQSLELMPHELQRLLDSNNGSIEKSWRAAGLSSRHALARLVKKYGLRLTRQTARG